LSAEVDLEAFLSGFVAESDEHLRSCRAAVIEIGRAQDERGGARPRAVRTLFRALHTMKGLAAMVGVEPLVDLLHRMETVLRAADQSGGVLSTAELDVLVRGIEAVEQRLREVARDRRASPAPAPLLAELEALRPEGAEAPMMRGIRLTLESELASKLTPAERAQIVEAVHGGKRALRVDFVPSPARAERGVNITTIRERASSVADLVRVLPVSLPRSGDAPGGLSFVLLLVTDADDAKLAAALGNEEAGPISPLVDATGALDESEAGESPEIPSANFVRVAVDRLDRTMLALGATVVARSRVDRAIDDLARRGVDVRALRDAAEEHGRSIRDLRESIQQIRMIPVAEMLEPIPLIVRGLRSTTGKQVRVELAVARAELDKSVAETVFPAIVHLVRNAVDHGIEPAARRRELGKPENGTIQIEAATLGTGMLELSISDDGAGIDAAAVARRVGVPVPDDDAVLLALIAQPGMSTRAHADHTSGRGLGMDIVQRVVVQSLGGELRLHNRPGAGATFVMQIPLTLTIVDGLAFQCGAQSFVVPLSVVDELLDLDRSRMKRAPDPDRKGRAPWLLEHRGEIVPYMSLAETFGLADDAAGKGMVVRRAGRSYAFGIDKLLGMQEVVVRPLEDPLVRVPGVAGATDLGDGLPTLVLDLVTLMEQRVLA
jgi:two-component system, chemotaxis family, sensor kinase CheA